MILRKGIGLLIFVAVFSLMILLSQQSPVAGFSPTEINRVAETLMHEGRYLDAIQVMDYYSSQITAEPQNERLLLRIGYCWYMLDEKVKSAQTWKQFIAKYPNSEYLPLVVKLYKQMNKPSEAVTLEL